MEVGVAVVGTLVGAEGVVPQPIKVNVQPTRRLSVWLNRRLMWPNRRLNVQPSRRLRGSLMVLPQTWKQSLRVMRPSQRTRKCLMAILGRGTGTPPHVG